MAFTVELTIRGLCALVPNEPINFELLGKPGEPGPPGQPQRISGMTVLVINEREPRSIPNHDETDPKNLEVCGHLPLLRYPRLEENKLSNFLILAGHRIEITDVEAGPDPGKALEIDPSFREWIPMDFAVSGQLPSPNPVRIDRRFLEEPVLPAKVAGRLDLKAGTVTTERSVGIWDFIPSFDSPNPNRTPDRFKFASEVQVSIPIKGDRAVLRLFDRNGIEMPPKELKPKPDSPANNRSVKILLSNLCLEGAEDEERPRIEGDFAVFYELLDNYNGVFRVPRLLGGPNGGPGTAPGGANQSPACTGTFMNR